MNEIDGFAKGAVLSTATSGRHRGADRLLAGRTAGGGVRAPLPAGFRAPVGLAFLAGYGLYTVQIAYFNDIRAVSALRCRCCTSFPASSSSRHAVFGLSGSLSGQRLVEGTKGPGRRRKMITLYAAAEFLIGSLMFLLLAGRAVKKDLRSVGDGTPARSTCGRPPDTGWGLRASPLIFLRDISPLRC
jgi:hypothetical protein